MLLVVAAGVLAMHGLAGGSHRAMASEPVGHSAMSAAAAEVSVLAANPQMAGHDAMDLCIAVLSALLLLASAWLVWRQPQEGLTPRPRWDTAGDARGPPRRRLLELCISRT